jgi:hypothetical protein
MVARRVGQPGFGIHAGLRVVAAPAVHAAVHAAVRTAVRAAARSSVVAAVVAAAFTPVAAAFAQDSAAEDVRRRLDDRYYFVESLGRGWEPLLADFRVEIEGLPETARLPVRGLRDKVVERYADLRLADGTEAGTKRAFELFESLSVEGGDVARRPEFARKCATIEVGWATAAEKAGDDAKALALATSAATRSPGFDPAYGVIARLGVREAERAEARDDFDGALAILSKSAGLLPATTPARATIVDKERQIRAGTGLLSFEWLGDPAALEKVRGPKTTFASGTIEFRPLEGQKATAPKPVAAGIRVRKGRYAIVARGTGNGPPTWEPPRELVVAPETEAPSGTYVLLPVALPANMVLVPPVGNQDAFLIDRTEVTETEFASPGTGNLGGSRTAASGVSFPAAEKYARDAGKALPTLEQWVTAAFGDPAGRSREFPWGGGPARPGTHFIGGESYQGPQSVDSCPAGASQFGCLNMAGNVMEWLADRRFVGGSFKRDSFVRDVEAADETVWTADYLRLPIYAYEAWDSLAAADRAKFKNWKANQDGSTYAQVGLRCVVPLGKPWRKKQ